MDISEKIRDMKTEIDKITNEEQAIKSRIADLKRLNEEKTKRSANLAKLQAEEAELLKELGL